jgi:nitroreductase
LRGAGFFGIIGCEGKRLTDSMDLRVESWYEAIFQRHSRRTYDGRLPEEHKIESLKRVCRDFRPFPGARAEIILSRPDLIFKGLIGSYGRVAGAACYAAFVGDLSSSNVQEVTGYIGEGFILEATALGLNTCWVGGYFRPERVRDHIPLAETEKVLSVTPLGYAMAGKNSAEKLISGFIKSYKRKPITELLDGTIRAPWMGRALEAAHLAPSAVNRQPWRFSFEDKAIVVSVDKSWSSSPVSKRLDCGIAMLHLELGARVGGIHGKWEFLEPPAVAKFVF